MHKDELIEHLHEMYRKDPYIQSLFTSAGLSLDNLEDAVNDVKNQYWFDTITWGIPTMEKILDFKTNINDPIEARRSQLEARWKSAGKADLYLLQAVANSWKNGDCEASFVNGKIQVQFTGEYGTPADLDNLKKALENVKPEHLAIVYSFRYLTIGEVQNMTISQLQNTKLSEFAF